MASERLDLIELAVDANILSFMMSDLPEARRRVERYRPDLEGRVLGLPFQARAELEVGLQVQGWAEPRFRELLQQFMAIPYSDAIQEHYIAVQTYFARERRRNEEGRRQKAADAWNAAAALWLDVPIVTHNRADFEGIPGLEVVFHADPKGQGV